MIPNKQVTRKIILPFQDLSAHVSTTKASAMSIIECQFIVSRSYCTSRQSFCLRLRLKTGYVSSRWSSVGDWLLLLSLAACKISWKSLIDYGRVWRGEWWGGRGVTCLAPTTTVHRSLPPVQLAACRSPVNQVPPPRIACHMHHTHYTICCGLLSTYPDIRARIYTSILRYDYTPLFAFYCWLW